MTKKDIVWSNVEMEDNKLKFHAFYSSQRLDEQDKPYWGNSALCNNTLGAADEEGKMFLPIGLVPNDKINRRFACKECLAAFESLKENNDINYVVYFDFTVAKGKKYVGKKGETELATDVPKEILMQDKALEKAIKAEMERNLKKPVVSVVVTKVVEKSTKNGTPVVPMKMKE